MRDNSGIEVTTEVLQEGDAISGVIVKFEELGHWYSRLSNDQNQHEQQETKSILDWFGTALRDAKELRNNNNYEALFIAHEYDHEVMTDAFVKLARTMSELARKSLERFGVWFARYLDTSTCEEWDWASEGKIGFAQPFLEHRVPDAIEAWYGSEMREAVEHLIKPITALSKPQDSTSAAQIRHYVDFEMFSPKSRLMRGFERKTDDLCSLLDTAPTRERG